MHSAAGIAEHSSLLPSSDKAHTAVVPMTCLLLSHQQTSTLVSPERLVIDPRTIIPYYQHISDIR